MSYFCCEILAMQHAVLILATNRNLNQSGSSHGSISCTNIPSIGKTGKTLNYGTVAQMLILLQHGNNCSMLCSFLRDLAGNWRRQPHSWSQQDSWKPSHVTQQQQQNNLPNTRSEVSKLKLSQLSTLRRRHSSLIWSLAMIKTAKRPVFSQGSLVGTCIRAFSSVLAIEVIWIASQMLGQDSELGHVPVLPAICLGAGLLDERDKPWVGENVQSFSSDK